MWHKINQIIRVRSDNHVSEQEATGEAGISAKMTTGKRIKVLSIIITEPLLMMIINYYNDKNKPLFSGNVPLFVRRKQEYND